MKNCIRTLIGSVLAFLLGLGLVRQKILSEEQDSATISETIKDPYIRDSKEREEDMGEEIVHKYQVYSREHLEELRKIFPLKRWDKTTSEAELAYSAGQQSVIDSIQNRLNAEGRKAYVLN